MKTGTRPATCFRRCSRTPCFSVAARSLQAEFRRLIDGLDCDYKELLQPVEAKGVKGDWTMRIRALGCALASAACLLLTACSHPQLMDPGMTESQVRTELGAPHAAVDTGKGTQRWSIPCKPFGQEVWWIEFDADGRIVRREEVLDRRTWHSSSRA